MEWLPQSEIQRRSEISGYETLSVCIDKKQQILDVSEEEFRRAYEAGEIGFGREWCGCCVRWGLDTLTAFYCDDCVLADDGRCCKESLEFLAVLHRWDKGKANFSQLQSATRRSLRRLCQERDKL